MFEVDTILNIIDDVLNCPNTLEEAKKNPSDFTRQSKMSFKQACIFLLEKHSMGLQSRLNVFFKKLGKVGSMTKQGFSLCRAKFNHKPFEKINKALVKKAYSNINDFKTWNGYIPFGIDGSRMSIESSDELRKDFGTFGSENNIAAGMSVCADLLNNWIIHATLTRAAMNERHEAMEHIDHLCAEFPHLLSKIILLFDRGYQSLKIFEELCNRGVKFVIRCQSSSNSKIINAPIGDTIIEYDNGLKLRVIKFYLSNGKVAILATNLFDFLEHEIIELYPLRWGVETTFKTMKQKINITEYSGKSTNAVKQDFWVSIILMNITAVFQNIADKVIQTKKEKSNMKNKYKYKANTSDIVETFRASYPFLSIFIPRSVRVFDMYILSELMSISKVAIEPGRSYPRYSEKMARTYKTCKPKETEERKAKQGA